MRQIHVDMTHFTQMNFNISAIHAITPSRQNLVDRRLYTPGNINVTQINGIPCVRHVTGDLLEYQVYVDIIWFTAAAH